MQTFLPLPDFQESAQCLDFQRLGKQRVETLQILNTLTGRSEGWKNHPATKMWRGYTFALAEYGSVICREWIKRGYQDTCLGKILDIQFSVCSSNLRLPEWFGDPEFHLSHQSNLIRKLPEHYRQFWPDVPSDLPYIWPKA